MLPRTRLDQITEEDAMQYYIYLDSAGKWKWFLEAQNGKKIADSGEGYFNKQDCLQAISLIQGSALALIYNLSGQAA